jgi:aminoglycoside 6'-N-acetyltransferase I
VIQIADLLSGGEHAVRQAAGLLLEPDAFAWQSLDDAIDEVRACLADGNIARMAVDGPAVQGWTGAQPRGGGVWELHPLVVRSGRQRQGIGTALVADLEQQVRNRGGDTLFLGADVDIRVEQTTSWAGLQRHLPDRLRGLPPAGSKQYEFYARSGYVIVGVVPDGKGYGNIYMAKRIALPAR